MNLNIPQQVLDSNLPQYVKLLAAMLQMQPYVLVGDYFKTLSTQDVEYLLARFAEYARMQPEQLKAVTAEELEDLIMIIKLLALGEGLYDILNQEDNMEKATKEFQELVKKEVVARHLQSEKKLSMIDRSKYTLFKDY